MEQFHDRRIIRLDAPGTGLSSTPVFPVDIPALAEISLPSSTTAQRRWADVIGFSYGGAVAQQLAFDHPTRVRRLVLAATNCGIGAVPGWLPARDRPGNAAPLLLAELLRSHRGGDLWRRDRARSISAAPDEQRAPQPSAVARWLRDAVAGHLRLVQLAFLPRIPHETLVICGDDDPLVPVANARDAGASGFRGHPRDRRGRRSSVLVGRRREPSRLISRFLNSETTDPNAPRRTGPRPTGRGRARAASA